jgi:ABC-2 type transport system permease protein
VPEGPVAGGAPPIEVRGLTKRYGEIVAVDGVDLTIEPGDVFGYLGPNGAGKTTSLRMMLGLIRPTAGSVRVFGRDPQVSVAALDGVAGFVEAPSFYPYFSGRRNLELFAALDGPAIGSAARIDEVLEVVSLRDRAKDRVRGYSHGMRQRLGIAAALLRSPRLLILDEPTTGLDPAGMRDMRELVLDLAARGITVLLSSHLLVEVDELLPGPHDRRRARAGDPVPAAERPSHRGRRVRRALLQGRRRTERRRLLARPRRGGHRGPRAESQACDAGGALLPPHRGRGLAGAGRRRARRSAGGRLMPSVFAIYRWELRKLRAQKRTYLGLGAAAVIPLIFVIALVTQGGEPRDVVFGRYVHDTGLAIPLVLLLFGSIWMFPLITALVAGDIVAAEDRHDTLKAILTRSAERHQIFAAKALAAASYAIAAIAITGVVALVAGILASGFNPITSLSGTEVSAPHGLALVGASMLVYLLPILAIASIALLLSTALRNSGAAIVGTLMFSLLLQLVDILPGLSSLHPYLLSTQFNAWQGFLRTPIDWAPIVRAVWICALYAVPALIAAGLIFLRRDVASE